MFELTFNTLNTCVLEIGVFEVNLGFLLLSFPIVGIIISAFWRGSKT